MNDVAAVSDLITFAKIMFQNTSVTSSTLGVSVVKLNVKPVYFAFGVCIVQFFLVMSS